MKKVLITILAFLYLGLASGVVMNIHYCMGQLSSVEYGYDDHDQCSKCGMTEKDGCCSTEFKVIKLQDSHQWAKSGTVLKKSFTLSTVFVQESSHLIPHYYTKNRIDYHSPPDLRTNLLFLYTCSFRI